MLRRHGVVGKFVEFYGPGVGAVPLANRATIGNMSPEYGSTCAIFPIDDETLRYLRFTGRKDDESRARRGLRQGERALARPGHRAGVLRDARARPVDRRAVARRPEAPAGPRAAEASAKPMFREALTSYVDGDSVQDAQDEAEDESFPASDPASGTGDESAPAPTHSAADGAQGRSSNPVEIDIDGAQGGDRPRRRGDRGDHVVHEHVEPVGDDRRGAAGEERRREGPHPQAMGQDVAGARARRSSPTTTTAPA